MIHPGVCVKKVFSSEKPSDDPEPGVEGSGLVRTSVAVSKVHKSLIFPVLT